MKYANFDKMFMSSNNIFITFFTYIKMSKNSSARYYQEEKKKTSKKQLVKDIKVLRKKKKTAKICW